ncbi:MAG: Gfo/Idh/MocA family oxidoreductase [Verrucomicrobiota bacterium]
MKRRHWLAASASASLGFPAILRGQNLNSRVQLAAVGTEGKGYSDLSHLRTHPYVEYVALCDVDTERMNRARHEHPTAHWFQDFREMVSERGDEVDGVVVSTPDHMHARITLDAIRRGKHVYCQKPLTHSVWEARQVRTAANQANVITRMGNHLHSHEFYRTGTLWIQEGEIGKVREVHSWSAATGQGTSVHHLFRAATPSPRPPSLDWDLWLGVAPFRPYRGHRIHHPYGWRHWQDFGNGSLGDFGCHLLDPVFTALSITGAPLTVSADHTGMNDQVWPTQTTVHYTFPGTDATAEPTLPLTWYDGGRMPPPKKRGISPRERLPLSGSLFVGESGTLLLPHVGRPILYRQGKRVDKVPRGIEGRNHYHGWIDGILDGNQPSDGFDYAGPLTEAVLLGNIAVRFPGETLAWEPEALSFANQPAAEKWLRRDYRHGWEID